MASPAGPFIPRPANLTGVDYRAGAAALGPPPAPIIDIHAHINGPKAAAIYGQVAKLYGVTTTFSMTRLDQAEQIRSVLGEKIRFIAMPNFANPDRVEAMGRQFLEDIRVLRRDFDCRIVKLWNAPRLHDLLPPDRAEEIWGFASPWRVRIAELAAELGMMIMVHVADPDTWFATKYADAGRYGTKASQYESLEKMLRHFQVPWIAAHMGGWPEDLNFLDDLLGNHPNLHLDTSATKWMVRELGKHPREEVVEFFTRWRGRLLFGSDIVTTDEHLAPIPAKASPMGDLADSPEAAFELYASRYYALRTMWETDFDGPSPIADPDLMMVEPEKHNERSSPTLRGLKLPRPLLEDLYADAARILFNRVGVKL